MPNESNNLELFYNDELFSREEEFINNDPWALAQREGITILSDKEFLCGHVVDTGEGKLIVSAVFDAFDNGNKAYSFDTAVDHRYQRQGLGAELIDIAMRKFKSEILDVDPEAVLDLDVVNENMVDFLTRKYGLSVKEKQGGHTLMGRRMRVEASKVLAQTVQERNTQIRDEPYKDHELSLPTRSYHIAEIQQAALTFASEFLSDYDLPSSPIMRVGNTQGFEDSKKAFVEMTAVIHVHASFTTLGQHIIRIDLAIPYYKGELQRPSIVSYQDKRYVFSQDFLTDIIANLETNKPMMIKPMTPTYMVERKENVVKPLFSAPNDPSGWSLLLTERY